MEHVTPNQTEHIARILVATDFSSSATTALNWAIEIAKAHRADIELIHAVEIVASESIPLELQEAVARSLAVLEETARRAGVDATGRFKQGRAWEVVAEAAIETLAELIVVGARGQTAYARPLLGSRADRIVRSASVPVLTVHPDDTGDLPKTILVATDFSEEAALATSTAVRLIQSLPDKPRLILLHAWQPLIQYEYAWAPNLAVDTLDESMQQARTLLEGLASSLDDGGFQVDAVVRHGYPAHVIEREAQAIGADLIALGTHGRSGLKRLMLGSVAERVLHHAHCPVLSVRHPDAGTPVRMSEEAVAP